MGGVFSSQVTEYVRATLRCLFEPGKRTIVSFDWVSFFKYGVGVRNFYIH